MTQQQIQIIRRKMEILPPCVEFAKKYLTLPSLEIHFDDCPSQRFRTMNNAAESNIGPDGIGRIWFNGPWFAERIFAHQDDVEFFMFHELRHLHQKMQINQLLSNQRTREAKETVMGWKTSFENYQRNEGGTTQTANVTQEVEIDANAYGMIMTKQYRNGKEPNLSLPDEAYQPAAARAAFYLFALPEFQSYLR